MTPHEQRVSRAGFAQALHKAIDRGKEKEEETQESMRDSAKRDALDKISDQSISHTVEGRRRGQPRECCAPYRKDH
jgi:hypothetical protein